MEYLDTKGKAVSITQETGKSLNLNVEEGKEIRIKPEEDIWILKIQSLTQYEDLIFKNDKVAYTWLENIRKYCRQLNFDTVYKMASNFEAIKLCARGQVSQIGSSNKASLDLYKYPEIVMEKYPYYKVERS